MTCRTQNLVLSSPASAAATAASALARPLVIDVTISHNLNVPVQIGVKFLRIMVREPINDGLAAGSMPKSKGRKRPYIPNPQLLNPPLPPASPNTTQTALGYDPRGPMEQRDIVNSKDGWSEFTLDDGSTIRTKVAMIDVKRAVGQFNLANGDPTYVMQMTIVTNLAAPDHLKKQNQK
jgi:hypothetical protein